MPEIILEEGDRVDWALKTFKRMMQKAGVLYELKKRRYYMKPSVAKLVKSKAAQRGRDKAKRKREGQQRRGG